ncbi:phage tail protein [Plantactinospora sp. KLBMP9567]|uniref:phage tail protein n=1 Tax=Plantactinospora sp. KLBMP9567 TaxID=3085900 RepID=UPI002980FA12|nr:phage tail protein [Plantactinospora sp. KLBMP9567]MDW5330088.1 phage tail protein [Plantactinospora sp. KLBMP9567]
MSITPKSAQPDKALSAARYSLQIDGVEIAAFPELSGISSEVLPAELESTGREAGTRRLPGKAKPATLVLKRGKNSSLELWNWQALAISGDPGAARNGSLVMYATDGTPVARYHLEHAWPSKLEIGAVKAGAGEVLMETVTIVCERLQRVSV